MFPQQSNREADIKKGHLFHPWQMLTQSEVAGCWNRGRTEDTADSTSSLSVLLHVPDLSQTVPHKHPCFQRLKRSRLGKSFSSKCTSELNYNFRLILSKSNAFLLYCLSVEWHLKCWVFGAWRGRRLSDHTCPFSSLGLHAALLRRMRSLWVSDRWMPWDRLSVYFMAASSVWLPSLWQLEVDLGAAGGISQVVGNQRERVLLWNTRGKFMGIYAVEVSSLSLLPLCSYLAK